MLSLVTDARMCALTAVPEGTQTWSFMGLDEISSLCVTVFRQTLSPHSQWKCAKRGVTSGRSEVRGQMALWYL